MRSPVDWQSAYVAVSALLGEPLESATAALPSPPSTGAAELLGELASPSRTARVQALARATTSLLMSLDGESAA